MQSQCHLVDMISENAVPPVCRLLNHSKVAYEAKVKERQAEKKQNENRRVALIKEVGLSCCVSFSCISSADFWWFANSVPFCNCIA